MYTVSKAKKLSSDDETELLDILAGELQGETLAPCLFIVALGHAFDEKKRKEKNLGFKIRRRPNGRIRPVCITDLHLPDDIALISEQF